MRSRLWSVPTTLTAALLVALVLLHGPTGCDGGDDTAASEPDAGPGPDAGWDPGKGDWASAPPEPLNSAAGDLIVYELQARSANACHPDYDATCADRAAPTFEYHGPGCDLLPELQAIRKSTLDALLLTHEQPHRSKGITLQYVDEVVGANTVWLMPVHPHNYRWDLPHDCDDLGSPYAVRDYYHVRGSLADRCVAAGKDEWSDTPCWGDEELRQTIEAAHARGLKVMLDLAFNHVGHEYLLYDYADVTPVREYMEAGKVMWDFRSTHDRALLQPSIIDSYEELPAEAAEVLEDLCPGRQLEPLEAVRRYLMWRLAFDDERASMSCDRPATLEQQVPGFYLGANGREPARDAHDIWGQEWPDVKYLFHEETGSHQWHLARSQELAFRVVNYYLALGVDGFRMDHANGLSETEWRYIFRKARRYQELRGGPDPIFLSESFHNMAALNRVFDVLTEGYQYDVCHGRRWASDLERVLHEQRQQQFQQLSYILLSLESHDEGRLIGQTSGFDMWRGSTFYAIGAALRGVPMVQIGQEWGEEVDLAFRRSDYLPGRLPDHPTYAAAGDALSDWYRTLHRVRSSPDNVALRHGETRFLRTHYGEDAEQLLAFVRYMPDGSNTIFAFYRLWVDEVHATFAIPDELAAELHITADGRYTLVDLFTGERPWAEAYPGGRTGRDLQDKGLWARLDLSSSVQWFRLEAL